MSLYSTAIQLGNSIYEKTVLQVDDSPRYECASQWTDNGQKYFWECEAPSPLPRREFSQRNDYDVLLRRNRHQMTDKGWIHEQDNKKIRSDSKTIIAEEKGLNQYTRVDLLKCKSAKNWWKDNKKIWYLVQEQWMHLKAQNQEISLLSEVEQRPLWDLIFQWTEKNKNYSGSEYEKKILQEEFLKIVEKYYIGIKSQ